MYDINKLIEIKKQRHFYDFRDEIRLEYKRISKWYDRSKIKDKDKQLEIESYIKSLADITYTLDALLLSDNPSCEPSVSHILKPIVEYYISIRQLTANVLKAF